MTSQTVEIRPGRIGLVLIALMTLLGWLAVFASGLSLWLQSILAVFVLSVAAYSWIHWSIHRRWTSIRLRHDGLLQLTATDGRKTILEPTRKAFLSPLFMAFAVREANRRVFFIAGFYDQFEPDQYRRLLSWMRFGF